eukprot:IDg7124t1
MVSSPCTPGMWHFGVHGVPCGQLLAFHSAYEFLLRSVFPVAARLTIDRLAVQYNFGTRCFFISTRILASSSLANTRQLPILSLSPWNIFDFRVPFQHLCLTYVRYLDLKMIPFATADF